MSRSRKQPACTTRYAAGAIAAVAMPLVVLCGCPVDNGDHGVPDIGGTSDFVGADVCMNCHRDIHSSWSASRHAQALETLKAIDADRDSDCLTCHTTGYREGGFVSTFSTPKFGGVQCESCHGPGAKHVGTRNPKDILRIPLTDVCAECHSGPAQPNHEEWLQSAHADALQTILNASDKSDACLTCHSNDYATAARRNASRALKGLPPDPLPSVVDADSENDPVEGVGCAACHAPHGSSNYAQLRSAPTQTCAACHTDTAPTPGTPAHAPQFNLLTAFGGYGPGASAGQLPISITGTASVHSALDSIGGCAKCHGENVRLDNPTEAMPNRSGHRFELVLSECVQCHGSDVATLLADRQTEIGVRLGTLWSRAELYEAIALTPFDQAQLDAAILNLDLVTGDGSLGAHNINYARNLLDAAEDLMDRLPPLP